MCVFVSSWKTKSAGGQSRRGFARRTRFAVECVEDGEETSGGASCHAGLFIDLHRATSCCTKVDGLTMLQSCARATTQPRFSSHRKGPVLASIISCSPPAQDGLAQQTLRLGELIARAKALIAAEEHRIQLLAVAVTSK